MKRFLMSAVAVGALAVAAPVFAQDYPATPSPAATPGQDIHGQIDALRLRVKAGFDRGELSQDYTKDLYRKLDRLQAIERSDRSASGSLSEHDRTTLQERIDRLSRSIHWKRVEGSDPGPMTDAAPPPPPPPAPSPMA